MNDPASNSQNSERLRDQLFGAKLEAAETRMDARIAAIEATLAAFIERIDERLARIEAKLSENDLRFARIEARMSGIEATMSAIQNAISGLKVTMIVTAIGAVIGVATFNATVLSNMVTAFESGKNMSETQAKILRQSEETAALLKQIQQGMLVPPPRQQPAR